MPNYKSIHPAHAQNSASFRCMMSFLETIYQEMNKDDPCSVRLCSLVRCAESHESDIFVNEVVLMEDCECYVCTGDEE